MTLKPNSRPGLGPQRRFADKYSAALSAWSRSSVNVNGGINQVSGGGAIFPTLDVEGERLESYS